MSKSIGAEWNNRFYFMTRKPLRHEQPFPSQLDCIDTQIDEQIKNPEDELTDVYIPSCDLDILDLAFHNLLSEVTMKVSLPWDIW